MFGTWSHQVSPKEELMEEWEKEEDMRRIGVGAEGAASFSFLSA